MGSGIATTLVLSNYYVILKEVFVKFLDTGICRVQAFKLVPLGFTSASDSMLKDMKSSSPKCQA